MITNQVTTNLSGGAASHGFQQQPNQPPQPSGGYLQAALGTKWAHCVNVRLVLERASADSRLLKVVKSPCCANTAIGYRITSRGVEEVAEGGSAGQQGLPGQNVVSMAIANEVDYSMGLG